MYEARLGRKGGCTYKLKKGNAPLEMEKQDNKKYVEINTQK